MRLFFALWSPTDAAEQLAVVARATASRFSGKPTRAETIHLTLTFLGDVPEAQLPLLRQTAQSIRAEPFELDIDCLGFWNKNHLLWVGNALPNATPSTPAVRSWRQSPPPLEGGQVDPVIDEVVLGHARRCRATVAARDRRQ